MKRWSKLYLPFSLNAFKTELSYVGAFYLFIVISLFGSMVSYALWMAIYGSSGSEILGGLSRMEMVRYVFMAYVTNSIVSVSIMEDVGYSVVRGEVAIYLIKPIDYRLSLVAKALGRMVYRFLVPGVWIWLGVEVYQVWLQAQAPIPLLRIGLFLASCCLSFLIYVLFDFCFGMIAFYTSHVFGMYMIKTSLLSFLSGTLIPLSFFPQMIRTLFDYLPFSSMIYTPLMIYLGKFEGGMLGFALLRQTVWVVLLYAFGSLIWGNVTKRLTIMGG